MWTHTIGIKINQIKNSLCEERHTEESDPIWSICEDVFWLKKRGGFMPIIFRNHCPCTHPFRSSISAAHVYYVCATLFRLCRSQFVILQAENWQEDSKTKHLNTRWKNYVSRMLEPQEWTGQGRTDNVAFVPNTRKCSFFFFYYFRKMR